MRLTEAVDYSRVYWVNGSLPKTARLRNEVTDPPNAGWSHVFVYSEEGKASLLVCPYTLRAFWVSSRSAEFASLSEPTDGAGSALDLTPERRRRITGRLLEKWEEHQKHGWQSDYDEVAIVLRSLNMEVPMIAINRDGTEDTRSRGGKPAADRLLKPVKAAGKRGTFLRWFLDGEGNRRSVREAMAEFDMTRSNVLSYLYVLNKDSGVGYDLVGDAVTVTLPEGCKDPFSGEPRPAKATKEDDDSWLD